MPCGAIQEGLTQEGLTQEGLYSVVLSGDPASSDHSPDDTIVFQVTISRATFYQER